MSLKPFSDDFVGVAANECRSSEFPTEFRRGVDTLNKFNMANIAKFSLKTLMYFDRFEFGPNYQIKRSRCPLCSGGQFEMRH